MALAHSTEILIFKPLLPIHFLIFEIGLKSFQIEKNFTAMEDAIFGSKKRFF